MNIDDWPETDEQIDAALADPEQHDPDSEEESAKRVRAVLERIAATRDAVAAQPTPAAGPEKGSEE